MLYFYDSIDKIPRGKMKVFITITYSKYEFKWLISKLEEQLDWLKIKK